MYKVDVIKNGVMKFGASFETETEAQAWINQQEKSGSWGKKEVIMIVTERVPPMELIEEVKNMMGVKAYKVRLPADYEVIIEEIVPEPKDLTEDIRAILLATDWLFISDVPMPSDFRVSFKEYRQMLRNLTKRTAKVEEFRAWLIRTRPEYFKDGGNGEKMVEKFNTYIKD